jgi:hypothetical protein
MNNLSPTEPNSNPFDDLLGPSPGFAEPNNNHIRADLDTTLAGFDDPEFAARYSSDFITILSSADGKVLTKRHTATGTTQYDKGYLFTSREIPINSLDDLAAALDCKLNESVILGKIRQGVDPSFPHVRRLHARDGKPATYEPAAHRFAIVDVDEPEEVGAAIGWHNDMKATVRRTLEWLPPEFRGVDVKWRLTGSAGTKPGIRLRLAFMLDRPVTEAELKVWLADCPNVDLAVFNAVQMIYGNPVFDGIPDPIEKRSGGFKGARQRTASPPADLAPRVAEQRTTRVESGEEWGLAAIEKAQSGEEWALAEIEEMIAALPEPDDYNTEIVPIMASVAAFNIPEDPTMELRCKIVCAWACSGGERDSDGRGFRAAFQRAATTMTQIGPGTLIKRAQENGYELPLPWDPNDNRPDRFDKYLFLDRLKETRDTSVVPADAVVGYEPGEGTVFDNLLEIDVPRIEPILARSEKGQEILAKMIADLGGVAPEAEPKTKSKNRFGGRDPEADANRSPMSYWDKTKLLPKHPTVGFAYGKHGSHRTGLFTKLGLDAIDQGARVLCIAAEGAYGFEIARLPAARAAHNMPWSKLKSAWRTETETFNLLRAEDRQLLVEAYEWLRPNIIFIDVLTKVAGGVDINTPEGGMAVMNALADLARRFEGTVVPAHHPGKDEDRGMMGSALLAALADFVWAVSCRDDRVGVKVEKMKDGPADRTVRFDVEKASDDTPVVVDGAFDCTVDFQPADPIAEKTKAFLDRNRGQPYDKAGLVGELRASGVLPYGVRRGEAYIASLA